MQKYLAGSTLELPLVSDEVPLGSGVDLTITIERKTPVDVPRETVDIQTIALTGSEEVHVITLPTDYVGIRSIWEISWAVKDVDDVASVQKMKVMIQSEETLVKGVDSFMSYDEAILMLEDMPGVAAIKSQPKSEVEATLKNAYRLLSQYTYQDNTGTHYDLTKYDAAQLDALEPGFLQALCYAQLVEANEYADPNSVYWKRMNGIMSETIGESSMMFRAGAVNNIGVSRRAMMFLRNYLVLSARIERG